MNGKRGELTSSQIVSLVLLIGGFIVVAIAVFAVLSEDELQDRELCHLSILERATVPGVLERAVPLQCFTEKVCITSERNGECKEFAGEENVRRVVIKMPVGDSIQDIEQRKESAKVIEREAANTMWDCWVMTGQGKLDIFTGKENLWSGVVEGTAGNLLKIVKPKCIVCSRIAIASDVFEKDGKIKTGKVLSIVNVNDYLKGNNIPGKSISYYQAFTDEGTEGYSEFAVSEADGIKQFEKISQIATVFVQIKVTAKTSSEVFGDVWKSNFLIGAAAIFTGPGKLLRLGTGIYGVLVQTAVFGGVSAGLAFSSKENVKESQAISAGTCGEFETTITTTDEDGKKVPVNKGCSLVKIVKWDIDTINNLCSGGIEGNL